MMMPMTERQTKLEKILAFHSPLACRKTRHYQLFEAGKQSITKRVVGDTL